MSAAIASHANNLTPRAMLNPNIFDASRILQTGDVGVKAKGAADIIGLPFMYLSTMVGVASAVMGGSLLMPDTTRTLSRTGMLASLSAILGVTGALAELIVYYIAVNKGLNDIAGTGTAISV